MRAILTVLLFLIATSSFCQDTGIEYYVTGNGNLYFPIGNSPKGTYPILGYDKETDPKFLIGGFGVGLAALKKANEKIDYKAQVNLSKHTYWDEAINAIDAMNQIVGIIYGGTSDYSIGITATANYHLSERFTVGSGLGTQVLLVSLSRLPNTIYVNPYYQSEENELSISRNRYYKPVMPTIPIEIAYRTKSTIFSVRYEQALLNRLKGELKEYKKDWFGLLYFEAGFKLN